MTGAIEVNFKIVPGSAPAGADAPSTGTTLTRATPSAASSHLIFLMFCLLSREPRQQSAGPGGPRISPFTRPGARPGSACSGRVPPRPGWVPGLPQALRGLALQWQVGCGYFAGPEELGGAGHQRPEQALHVG